MSAAPQHDAPAAAALAEYLAWCRDAGLDVALGETPVDRFAAAPESPGRPLARVGTGGPPAHVVGPAADADRRPDPASAQTLEELRAMLEAFEGCALRTTATQLVFADGNPKARLMLVGEAPGADEDRIGRPFVGRAGQLLDKMLAAIGLDRTSVYIANVIPWRPPGNRTPTPQELALCLPFVTRQIELVAPDILVCLGGPSARTLLGVEEGITRARGKWMNWRSSGASVRAMPTLHPAYLLRQPAQKRLVWRDLQAIRVAIGGRDL